MTERSLWIASLLLAATQLCSCGGKTSSTGNGTAQNQWVWRGGSDLTFQSGNYGTMGQPSTQNVPGARLNACYWTDAEGNFWLFGGFGMASAHNSGRLDDIWKYSPATGEWTWVGGSQQVNQQAVYGTKGVASAANTPGGQNTCQSWLDPQGNFWLFTGSVLRDLWKLNPSTGEWTFMGGFTSETAASASGWGIYGTLGQPSPSNLPGLRINAVTWTDPQGDLWMYGGEGDGSIGSDGILGDLWKYSPSNGEWTWMGGSSIANTSSIYGQKGVASPANTPGARAGALFWSNGNGDVWLFGGEDSAGVGNDLWKYSNGEWTWVAGSDQPNQTGIYHSEGFAEPENTPGARSNSVTWMDAQGNLWLFGGYGLASVPGVGDLNDLWEFSNGEWRWASGPSTIFADSSYGTLNVASATNLPPGRSFSAGWVDSSGNLWLFGGGTLSVFGWYNDLWEYTP